MGPETDSVDVQKPAERKSMIGHSSQTESKIQQMAMGVPVEQPNTAESAASKMLRETQVVLGGVADAFVEVARNPVAKLPELGISAGMGVGTQMLAKAGKPGRVLALGIAAGATGKLVFDELTGNRWSKFANGLDLAWQSENYKDQALQATRDSLGSFVVDASVASIGYKLTGMKSVNPTDHGIRLQNAKLLNTIKTAAQTELPVAARGQVKHVKAGPLIDLAPPPNVHVGDRNWTNTGFQAAAEANPNPIQIDIPVVKAGSRPGPAHPPNDYFGTHAGVGDIPRPKTKLGAIVPNADSANAGSKHVKMDPMTAPLPTEFLGGKNLTTTNMQAAGKIANVLPEEIATFFPVKHTKAPPIVDATGKPAHVLPRTQAFIEGTKNPSSSSFAGNADVGPLKAQFNSADATPFTVVPGARIQPPIRNVSRVPRDLTTPVVDDIQFGMPSMWDAIVTGDLSSLPQVLRTNIEAYRMRMVPWDTRVMGASSAIENRGGLSSNLSSDGMSVSMDSFSFGRKPWNARVGGAPAYVEGRADAAVLAGLDAASLGRPPGKLSASAQGALAGMRAARHGLESK